MRIPDQMFDDEAILVLQDLARESIHHDVPLAKSFAMLAHLQQWHPVVKVVSDALHRVAVFEINAAQGMADHRAAELLAQKREAESNAVAGIAAQIRERRGDWKDPKDPF